MPLDIALPAPSRVGLAIGRHSIFSCTSSLDRRCMAQSVFAGVFMIVDNFGCWHSFVAVKMLETLDCQMLREAKAFCARHDTPRAQMSERIISVLLKKGRKTAGELALEAQCSRYYLYILADRVKNRQFERLISAGPLMKASLLSVHQRKALRARQ